MHWRTRFIITLADTFISVHGCMVGVKKVDICDCSYAVIAKFNCFTLWLLVIMAVL